MHAIASAQEIDIWKTIKLGTGLKTAEDFRHALGQAKMTIGGWGEDLLGKSSFTASEMETEVDLVSISVGDLGFTQPADRREIMARAFELGLDLCPAEVGPQLRLQYPDQPKGEWFMIAMEPITGSDGYPNVFCVGHDYDEGVLFLNGYRGEYDLLNAPHDRFVFVRPRK